ncbi:hypothetical protein EDC01DRAFT_680021 [Geopyxis carbonaria]|nr:hypothetical protein EDC01DRAFT_680021 [Geopyxis carbonaria]
MGWNISTPHFSRRWHLSLGAAGMFSAPCISVLGSVVTRATGVSSYWFHVASVLVAAVTLTFRMKSRRRYVMGGRDH